MVQSILPISHQHPYPRLQWCHAMRGNDNTSIFISVNELWATAWCATPQVCGHMGFHKGGGCLAADLCWCHCCKRVSRPRWNEGLLRAAVTEAGERIKWHWTCCVGKHTLLMLACRLSAFTYANTSTRMHACSAGASSQCVCCSYRPDCSHHGSPCSMHQKQADR